MEKLFSLGSVDYVAMWGVNERVLDFVRRLCPKVKLIARGEMLKVIGAEEDIEAFELLLDGLRDHYEKVGVLKDSDVIEIFERGGTANVDEHGEEVLVHGRYGNVVKAMTKNQRRLVDAVRRSDVVFAIGPAGTGKTYTAVALAVKALRDKAVRRIVLTRPAVEAGENLGFLPGDMRDKLDPYLQPLYDALRDMIPQERLLGYWEDGTIEVAPLAFMRGRTLDNAFVILDEAQNATPMQLKMFLTRMGRRAKFVVTGDVTQVDLPRGQRSGLVEAREVLGGIEGVEFVELDKRDVVRHRLVGEIIDAYARAQM